MPTGTMGHQTRFGLGVDSGAVATREFAPESNGLIKTEEDIQAEGMHASRDYRSEEVVDGPYVVGGPVVFDARPDDLAFLLPYILGGSASGTSFPLAQVLPELCAEVYKVADTYLYRGIKVNTATFRSAKGQLVKITLDLQGKTEAEGATFSNIVASLSAQQPYTHHHLVATIGGVAYNVDNVEITIANNLVLDRSFNSRTRISLPEGNRVITVSFDAPFTTDEAALYTHSIAGLATNTFVWTNGGRALTMTFGSLRAPTVGPPVQQRGQECIWRLNFVARSVSTTPPLAVTNVSA